MSASRLALVMALILVAAGCGSWSIFARDTKGTAPPRDLGRAEATVPEWRVGDRWVYGWTSGQEQGTRTVNVRESRTVNGVDFYVLDIGDAVQQYYTKDLRFAAGVQASRVVARMVPPQPWFVWPLKPAAQWRYQGIFEEQEGRRQQNDTYEVVGVEQVVVPGGSFAAFRIVRQTDRGDSDQYWYAPEVRWYIRWVGRRSEVEFEEKLQTYQAAPRLTPVPATR